MEEDMKNPYRFEGDTLILKNWYGENLSPEIKIPLSTLSVPEQDEIKASLPSIYTDFKKSFYRKKHNKSFKEEVTDLPCSLVPESFLDECTTVEISKEILSRFRNFLIIKASRVYADVQFCINSLKNDFCAYRLHVVFFYYIRHNNYEQILNAPIEKAVFESPNALYSIFTTFPASNATSKFQYESLASKDTAMDNVLRRIAKTELGFTKKIRLKVTNYTPNQRPYADINKIILDAYAKMHNLRGYPAFNYLDSTEYTFDVEKKRTLPNMYSLADAYHSVKVYVQLLGFSEEETVNKLKELDIIPKKTPMGFCDYTKQIYPCLLLMPAIENKNISLRFVDKMKDYHFINSEGDSDYYVKWSNTAKCYVHTKYGEHASHKYTILKYTENTLSFLAPKKLAAEKTIAFTSDKAYAYTPWLGFELEVERDEACPYSKHVHVQEALGRDYCILKHDGSLKGAYPFEIVSVPATLAYHKQRVAAFIENKELKANISSYTSGNCGMHVHISRNAFTGLHLAKFIQFFNTEDNTAFIHTIAQRGNTPFTRYTPMNKTMGYAQHLGGVNGAYMPDGYGDRTEGHRSAVNTANKDTVEVRIFRGNLAASHFYKNLEFVHAVWAYTKDASLNELNYKNFIHWLAKTNSKDYANLMLFIATKKLTVSNINVNITTKGVLAEKAKEAKKLQLVIDNKYTKDNHGNIKIAKNTFVTPDSIFASL